LLPRAHRAAGPPRRREHRRDCHTVAIVLGRVDRGAFRRQRNRAELRLGSTPDYLSRTLARAALELEAAPFSRRDPWLTRG